MRAPATHSSAAELRRRRGREAGFTLIELMITVVVIAILAAMAYSNYSEYVTRSRRAAAAGCLMETAQFLERFYTVNLSYATAPNPPPQCDPETAQFYTVSFAAAPTAKAYTLQAVPQGTQATRDTLCATLTLTGQGVRGEGGAATDATQCW